MKKIFLLLFIISACNFNTLHGDTIYIKNKASLSEFKINIIPNDSTKNRALEAKYFNLLHKELNIDKKIDDDFKYILDISLKWADEGSLRKSSGSSSRKNLALYVSYTIKDKKGEILDKDKIKTIDSSDVSDARFTNYSNDNFVLNNLVISSVDDLKNRLFSIALTIEQ